MLLIHKKGNNNILYDTDNNISIDKDGVHKHLNISYSSRNGGELFVFDDKEFKIHDLRKDGETVTKQYPKSFDINKIKNNKTIVTKFDSFFLINDDDFDIKTEVNGELKSFKNGDLNVKIDPLEEKDQEKIESENVKELEFLQMSLDGNNENFYFKNKRGEIYRMRWDTAKKELSLTYMEYHTKRLEKSSGHSFEPMKILQPSEMEGGFLVKDRTGLLHLIYNSTVKPLRWIAIGLDEKEQKINDTTIKGIVSPNMSMHTILLETKEGKIQNIKGDPDNIILHFDNDSEDVFSPVYDDSNVSVIIKGNEDRAYKMPTKGILDLLQGGVDFSIKLHC